MSEVWIFEARDGDGEWQPMCANPRWSRQGAEVTLKNLQKEQPNLKIRATLYSATCSVIEGDE